MNINEYKANSAINGRMEKPCCKCKIMRSITDFGALKTSPDGLRYDCKLCRKSYRDSNKLAIKEKQDRYYRENRETLLQKNRIYRQNNAEEITSQRKEYRSRPEVREHIKEKNREYLPIRKQAIRDKRKSDFNFRVSEVLRSKIHKVISGKETSFK
jgi:hypothetical protein